MTRGTRVSEPTREKILPSVVCAPRYVYSRLRRHTARGLPGRRPRRDGPLFVSYNIVVVTYYYYCYYNRYILLLLLLQSLHIVIVVTILLLFRAPNIRASWYKGVNVRFARGLRLWHYWT